MSHLSRPIDVPPIRMTSSSLVPRSCRVMTIIRGLVACEVVMKLRESEMPEESYWETLFDVELILDRLGIDAELGDVAELGCGYPLGSDMAIDPGDGSAVSDVPPMNGGGGQGAIHAVGELHRDGR